MDPTKITHKISGGLSDTQVETVHGAALEIVEKIGITVPHKGILSLISGQDGVNIHGNNVRFRSDIVESAFEKMDYPASTREQEWGIISGAYAMNILDGGMNETRSATLEDLRAATKLCDSLGFLGSAPICPMDIFPEPLREIAMYKISYENSRSKSSDIFDANPKSTIEVAEIIFNMAQVANRYFSVGVMVISPFRLMESELEIVYRFLDRKVPMMVTALPSAGATGPYPIIGAHVQSLAELMAAVTLLTQVSGGGSVYASPIDSIRAHPFDMKNASFVYGSPEDLHGTLIQCQLNHRYGIPIVAKSLLTNSAMPDEQAAAEKAAHTLAAALAGARIFTNAGVLAVDEVYSFEQAIIDREIVNYAKRVIEGFEFSHEALGVEAVIETGIGGNFLLHETTLTRFKKGAWIPDLFERSMFSQWKAKGSQSIQERARRLVSKNISDNTYSLQIETQRELDRIWETARRQFIA
jgi:trimethylamine---corrinoid protein Co-methyltransferase